MEKVGPQIDAGMPFIFLEPSCASVFKDELLEFFPNSERAQQIEPTDMAAGGLVGRECA